MDPILIFLLLLLCCWAIPADLEAARQRKRERDAREQEKDQKE
jgi:hypothetical protein